MGVNIMLALGSMIMFSTFLGSSNRVIMGNSQIASQNEYYIAALSYGQSVIEEAKTKNFQGSIIVGSGPGATKVNSLLLGYETTSEKISYVDTMTALGFASEVKFDDVDDYNGYIRRVNSPRAEGYTMVTSVNWVDETTPKVISATITDFKVMVVNITSPYFPKIEKGGLTYQDTLKLSYVFAK